MRLILALACLTAAVLALALAWFRVGFVPEAVEPASVVASRYQETLASPRSHPAIVWSRPQPRTDGWTFDLFTPPQVLYRLADGSFLMEPPRALQAGPQLPEIRLVGLVPEPYRFQWVGQAGAISILRDTENDRTVVARTGEDFTLDGHHVVATEEGVAIAAPDLADPVPLVLGAVTFAPLPAVTLATLDHEPLRLGVGETGVLGAVEVTILRVDPLARAADIACQIPGAGQGRVLTLPLGAAVPESNPVPTSPSHPSFPLAGPR